MTVVAQTYGALQITSPTGLEQIEAANNGTLLAVVGVAQLRDAGGYSKNAPQSGASLTFGSSTATASIMQISGSGTISALTITMAAAPVDGQRALIFANQAVSTLTLNANTGQTINNAVTSLTQNVAVEYLYSASNLTWDRIQ